MNPKNNFNFINFHITLLLFKNSFDVQIIGFGEIIKIDVCNPDEYSLDIHLCETMGNFFI
jgi:hypothetical protein